MTTRKAVLPTVLHYAVSLLIIGGCVVFVTFQTTECISKFLEYPQGTKMSIQFIGNTSSFPAITVCTHPEFGIKQGKTQHKTYNKTILDDCGIKRYFLSGYLLIGGKSLLEL